MGINPIMIAMDIDIRPTIIVLRVSAAVSFIVLTWLLVLTLNVWMKISISSPYIIENSRVNGMYLALIMLRSMPFIVDA